MPIMTPLPPNVIVSTSVSKYHFPLLTRIVALCDPQVLGPTNFKFPSDTATLAP